MQKVSIEYSIVSRGTEKYNNCGYMAISKIYNLRRYILNVDHNVKNTNLNANCLIAKSCYDIENIVFSRFQLITALTFERIKYRINDNILILGLGNIGISCLFYLLDNNFKNYHDEYNGLKKDVKQGQKDLDNSIKDIKQVTMYYVNKNNENY